MSQILDAAVGFADDGRIHVRGALDAHLGAQLGQLLAERLTTGASDVDVDLSAVVDVDEGGLVAVVRLWHEAVAQGHALRLVDPSPVIAPLLAMSGLPTHAAEE